MLRISDKLQLIGSAYLQQVIRVMTLFVMARYIGPADKGVFALVIYVAGLVMALGDFVIGQSIVQMHDFAEDVAIDTGLVLTSLLFTIYGAAAIFAGIYLTYKDPHHDPHYWRIGVMVAISNFLSGIYMVQLARLNRRLEFRAESGQNVVFAVSTALTGIVFAVLHYGSYALALQVLAGQFAANVAINLRVPLSWPRQFSWAAAKRFLKLGTPVSVAVYVRVVEGSITGLILKPIAGTFGLGLWSQSVQMQQLFSQNLMVSFQRVAYPLMCRSLEDRARLRSLFARVILIFMLISLLFTALVGVNSEAIVRVCLGPTWWAAAPLLRVTAWAIPAGALDMAATLLCMALGVSKIMVRSAVLNLVLFIPASLLIRHLGGGLLDLAICWSVSRYLIALMTMQAVIRKLEFGMENLWKPLAGLGGATVVSAAVMLGVHMITRHINLPIQLVVASLIGIVVYFAAVWLLEPNTVRDSLNMARGGRI